MLKVIDKKHFEKVKNKKLLTAYRYGGAEWRCTTADGEFLYLKYKGGILAATIGETEYEMGDKVMLVASTVDYDKAGKIFEEIILGKVKNAPSFPPLDFNGMKDFFEWEIDDDQIWD